VALTDNIHRLTRGRTETRTGGSQRQYSWLSETQILNQTIKDPLGRMALLARPAQVVWASSPVGRCISSPRRG
jgi:hypothetical protein